MFSKPCGRKTTFRRLLWMITAVMLIIGAAFAAGSVPEKEDELFAHFEGMEWSFCSGAGAWSTDLQIRPDGTFTGQFHDSEMGESAEAYPDGTVYICEFSGRFSVVSREDTNSWKLRVDELRLDEETGKETIEDGIRFVTTTSYGIEQGDELLLYQPGTPLEMLTEGMKFWAHLYDAEEKNPSGLQAWFMYSEKLDAGFVGVQTGTGVSVVNTWEALTAEQLRALTGLPLNLPDGAEQAAYRWYRIDGIAEMQFTWNSGDFCFRAQNTAPQEGTPDDISGMYFTWEYEEAVSVNGNTGILSQAQSGTGSTVERCLWYDTDRQALYSLSVIAPDTDGLDLAAAAEQIVTAK